MFAILVPALLISWALPDRTADLWAWTIKPELTPIFLGAGYAAGAFVSAAVFFLAPATAIDLWPWDLTPLTSRVLGVFTAQVGVGALLVSMDPAGAPGGFIVQTFFVATALLLVGAVRAFGDFDTANVMTYGYLGGLIGGDVALLLLYRSMSRQEQRG